MRTRKALSLFLFSLVLPFSNLHADDRVTTLFADTNADLQKSLQLLQGAASGGTCSNNGQTGGASATQGPGKDGTCACQGIDPAKLPAELENARLLSVNRELEIEKATPKQLRFSLLGEADQLMGFAREAREQKSEGGAQVASLLEGEAEKLRVAAEDPKLKQKLLDANAEVAPLKWKPEWARFRTGEKYATGALLVGMVGAETLLKTDKAHWKGGVAADSAIRDSLMMKSASGRNMADKSTTVLVTLLAGVTVADVGIAAWGKDSKDVAKEMLLIDLESYSTSLFLSSVLKNTLARTRPDGSDNKSFPSGHTSLAFTAASLICTHHSYLSLYGGGKDSAACYTALALAAGVGVGRIMADKHYASDVAAGAAIGLFAGAVLPRVLHYEWKGEKTQGVIAPTMVENSPGLSCSIAW